MAEGSANDDTARVDAAMDAWRQGDCRVGPIDFVALEIDGDEAKGYAPAFVAMPVHGLMVVSQSCDIARSVVDRPMLEVSPLVRVDAEGLEHILTGNQVQFAAVPTLTDQRLVADLDRTMTVHKAVAATWSRTPGPSTDEEVRRLARALARKRARFAFPDAFNAWVKPLSRRISKKHDSPESPEGKALRALQEIRVLAEPSWEATGPVLCTFYFVRAQDAPDRVEGQRWDQWAERWVGLLAPTTRYLQPMALVPDHSTMSAAEYLASDPLDLDHLSVVTPTSETP